ncbi:SET domain-containing protein [Canariomyces notabilis]|uniref:SET domain-containing protein n=1 Tax=Canariomyces notabilis TaxID=2074819 RepID=A0AAN6TES7_9PEZI|nr:SET domain-containing protein [Canariomyces arenarius]
MSPTRCRKAALMAACRDVGWSEKELRNKMAIWRGYKQIKDAAGWAALVFAGMGLYRLCKYRTNFTAKSIERLRTFRARIEIAADTLHPSWRQLLAVVSGKTQDSERERRFTGHPHDWVVFRDGSDPVPLRSTYLRHDPCFRFEHITESIVDAQAWPGGDDPRWIPPRAAAVSLAGANACRACAQTQSDDPKRNNCFCFPSLFGTGPRRRPPSPVQVFATRDGQNNGLLALVGFERGAAIGEFVGLVTRGIEDLDVLEESGGGGGGGGGAAVSHRPYHIWQGWQGNFTRFVNHSCNPNAQYQHFVWLGVQRVILVSKGIGAGTEITVDYGKSYWRGLEKRCLCGESCCRYNGSDRP